MKKVIIKIKSYMARRKKPVKQFTKEGIFVKMYDSAKTASAKLNIDKMTISKCCNGYQKTGKGFRFEFIND